VIAAPVNATAAAMNNPPRKLAFVVASTEHGTMIVNRFDEHRLPDNTGFGVGYQLFETASYDPGDVTTLLTASSPSIAAPISGSIRWNGPGT
jgi:hypothetical protein